MIIGVNTVCSMALNYSETEGRENIHNMEDIDSDESDFNNDAESDQLTSAMEAWPNRRGRGDVELTSSTVRLPSIMNLNVGGVRYVTRLSTLRKYPDSMLATMFSGRHRVDKDRDGNYFIDRDGATFSHILDFLRRGECESKYNALTIYKEGSYFGLTALTDKLLFNADICRMTVREAQKAQFSNYESTKQKVIRAAIEIASVSRVADVLVNVYREKFHAKANAFDVNHDCVVDLAHVTFGPWSSPANEEMFVSCLEDDLLEDGFQLKPREAKRKCKYYSGQSCQRFIYKLSFMFK